MNKMKNDKVIIIRISNDIKTEYEKLLNNNGMNLSKRIKLLITEDIKKIKNQNG
jgi:antitoxin component of RelBE/YafQ-DinJ toxin-antitoxin module